MNVTFHEYYNKWGNDQLYLWLGSGKVKKRCLNRIIQDEQEKTLQTEGIAQSEMHGTARAVNRGCMSEYSKKFQRDGDSEKLAVYPVSSEKNLKCSKLGCDDPIFISERSLK